jgi:hypothetical protein
MYATIHRFRPRPEQSSDEWGGALVAALHQRADAAGHCVLMRLDGLEGAVLTFWDGEEDATGAVMRGGEAGFDARSYRVVDHDRGLAAGRPPRFAQLTWLNAEGGPARADRVERAGRERIWPAVRRLEGIVEMAVLRAADDSMVAVGLCTDVDTPEAVRRAVFGTELLPWEDAAELGEPDRIDVDRVVSVKLPATAMVGGRS